MVMKSKETNNKNILGMRVDATSYRDAVKQILKWAVNGENRYVCAANVHMVMEAYENETLQQIVNQADLVVPDGMPLVWMLRRLGYSPLERVYGPNLMMKVLEAASKLDIPVGFYGGEPVVSARLAENLQQKFADLQIVYRYSPPFKSLTHREDEIVHRNIIDSQARILFIGLGCPKQELWMARHTGRIQAVMLGVGAAFDFHAGKVKQAPEWLQNKGLEWLFRLFTEPGRLWKRYLKHNPRFAALGMRELVRRRGPTTLYM